MLRYDYRTNGRCLGFSLEIMAAAVRVYFEFPREMKYPLKVVEVKYQKERIKVDVSFAMMAIGADRKQIDVV
jgi:hypothetical protein